MPASASCRALTPVGHDMTFNGGDEASMHTHFFSHQAKAPCHQSAVTLRGN